MIRLIAAIDTSNGIAKDGQIPWDLPKDKAYFKSQTLKFGGNVLMGRATFNQLAGPLKSRTNYVLSHSLIKLPKGVVLVNNLDTFLTGFKEDLWIIGGQSIYDQTIELADELYLTKVNGQFNCDQFFPRYDKFKLKSTRGPFHQNNLTFYFQVFGPN